MRRLEANQAVLDFSANNKPATFAKRRETIVLATADCYGGRVLPSARETWANANDPRRDPATGPVFVEGAEPGDALEVLIKWIRLADRGIVVLRPGIGVLGDRIAEQSVRSVEIEGGCAALGNGLHVPLRPMVGVIGIAPEGSAVSALAPGRHGGNMDTPEIGVGARVYLPVQVPGGLLALGDVHAAMGDGEISGTGVEIGAEVTIEVDVVKNIGYRWPRVETNEEIVTVVSDCSLEAAIRTAAEEMVGLVMRKCGVGFEEALMFVGTAGDVRISQIVNPYGNTVRMVVPKSALNSAPNGEADGAELSLSQQNR